MHFVYHLDTAARHILLIVTSRSKRWEANTIFQSEKLFSRNSDEFENLYSERYVFNLNISYSRKILAYTQIVSMLIKYFYAMTVILITSGWLLTRLYSH